METEELFDLIARTRPIILEVLDDQGYDIKPYLAQSPLDVVQMAMGGPNPLRVRVVEKEQGVAPKPRAQVFYWVFEKVKASLERRVEELWDTTMFGDGAADKETDQAIVILNEPVHDAFHTMAIKQWQLHKRRIYFFTIKQLISNPSKHILQPKFRKVPASEKLTMMQVLRLRTTKNLPLVKFHVDIMTRVLGLAPEDIVEIIRPSPTTGDYTMYRLCAI